MIHSGYDRDSILQELDQARLDFHDLLSAATPADLRRRSAGTRWTNQQLLFHMLFGYLITRALLCLSGFRPAPDCRRAGGSPGCWTPRSGRSTW